MRQRLVQKISDGEVVDLTKLNRNKLMRLHYEEEKWIAQLILELPPFSKERSEALKKMYDFAYAVMPWYLSSTRKSYGANEETVGVVCDFLRAKAGRKVIYEAGVGIGYSCRRFVKLPNVEVRGCDVTLSDEVISLMETYDNLSVDEDTLFNSLRKMENNSIDYFYADNVIEHLLPDEFPRIIKLLSQKMKQNGLLFLVIPNRLVGPRDVSKYFLAQGSKAEGSHFMEMSYRETLNKFKRGGVIPGYMTYYFREQFHYLKDKLGILNKIKIGLESILNIILKKPEKRQKCFYKMGLTWYILKKK